MQDSSSISTNVFNKPALVTDLNDSYVGKDIYTHGRNLAPYSINGDEGTLGNEQSNIFCVQVPYTFIGSIDLNDDRHIVFSTSGTLSQIGIVDTDKCTYTKVLSSTCLNFKVDKVMNGVAKKLFNGDIVTTFGQEGESLYRLNLSEIPYKYTTQDDACETKDFTKEVDCEEMLLFRTLEYPCFNVEKGPTGNLPNGTYAITIAYMADTQVFTDYFKPSQKIQVYEESNDASSLNVNIDNLDRNFNKYQLILIGNVKGIKTAAIIGEYPTYQSNVNISDFLTSTQTVLPLEKLVLRKDVWKSAGIISSNSNYLLLSQLTKRPKLNYQPQAMKIKAEYVVKQVLADYYEKSPKDINYYADENYDFYIQWLFTDGQEGALSHIGGRLATNEDRSNSHGVDVYEWDNDVKPDKFERWQAENTAGKAIPTQEKFINNERVAYRGKMGYFESTELYPDNLELFPEDACTPIRFHKFPDEEKVSRYEVINGICYINIKGVQFSNITYPKDKDGNRVKDIKGYQILRSDRKGGNKTVISTGIMTNVRTYEDQQNNKEIMFANYPYNDLSADAFLSSTQTTFNGSSEKNYKPLEGFYQNRFNYYSPHSLYNLKYKHGTEIKVNAEEIAVVDGFFEPVYGHPEFQLASNFSFWAAAMIGVAEAVLEATGAKSTATTTTNTTEIDLSVTGGIKTTTSTSVTSAPKTALEVAGANLADLAAKLVKAITSGDFTSIASIIKLLKEIILFIANAGIATVLFTMTAMKYAQNILDTIYNFLPFRQYCYQYNSHALFGKSIPMTKGNRRRKAVHQPQYLSSSLHTINGTTFNNFGKQESVYIELNRDIALPRNVDNSRQTISQFGTCDNPQQRVDSQASAYYAATKIANPNQYGQVGSAPKVLISDCISYVGEDDVYTSPILFGGDAIIAKQTIITKHPFFRQNLAVEYGNKLPSNFPNGIEYNYNLYRNIAYPRYWVDSTKYDYSQLLRKNATNFSTFSRTAASKHNLDCKDKDTEDIFSIDNAYFYAYNNGVMEFYAECDYNISFREKTEVPHYSDSNNNLSEIHRSTNLVQAEQFKLDKAFSDIYVDEVFAEVLPSTYNSLKESTIYPNAIIYSLPSFNLQTFDNWQYFLPSNFFSFRESDFGLLTGIHKLDQDRVIFLFSKSSPFISMGRDFLELENSGRKVSIGDGGLFAQDPREVVPTDVNYGACQSKNAFSATQFGYFYPSEKQGRIFQFAGQLNPITEAGIATWASNYMPIQLYSYFPTFKKENENPINDVGYLTVFDSDYGILYITKRDFTPKDALASQISYNSITNKFYYNGLAISLHNKDYFDDVSWTLSYDAAKKSFISWHDWHPDWIIQGDVHFLTVKDNAIWKHNEEFESYCNFYGKDYPFEIEGVSSDGQTVNVTRSAEWILNAYNYKNKGRDRFHLLNENFDKMIVHNTEQSSPLLTLVKHPQNPTARLQYPKPNGSGFDVLYTKEENKFRVNQFWDAVRDRGEFDNNEFHIFVTDGSGYRRTFNQKAIDLQKPERQRKKFRQQLTKFWLSKEVSKNHKFIVKLFNLKKYQSIR